MLISFFDSDSRFSSALLVSCISRVDFTSRFDDRLDLVAVLAIREFLAGAAQAGVVARDMPSASVISVITSSISPITRAPTLSMRSEVLMCER